MQMVRGCSHPYGYPHPAVAIYLGIHKNIRADVRVELSVERTDRPGVDLNLCQSYSRRLLFSPRDFTLHPKSLLVVSTSSRTCIAILDAMFSLNNS